MRAYITFRANSSDRRTWIVEDVNPAAVDGWRHAAKTIPDETLIIRNVRMHVDGPISERASLRAGRIVDIRTE